MAVESVTDSSRYFVIRIEDGNGRRAFIGIGFVDRGDAFDFNVALQDHFKWVKQQCEFAKQAQNPDQGPKLDLGFKEGQTIKLNIANMKKKEGAAGSPRARPTSTGGISLLPPPPGGRASTLVPPPGEQLSLGGSLVQPPVASGSGGATMSWPQPKPATAATADIWGDFTKSTGVHRADFWRCCPLAARVQAAHISAAHLVPVCRPGGQCRARRAWKPEGTACSRKVQARHGVRQPFCPLATLGTRVPSTAAPGGRGFPHWWFLKCLSRRQLLNYLLLQGLE